MSNNDRLEFLEEERKKIWKRLTDLEALLEKKTSDYELEAKTSSEQAKAHADKIQEYVNVSGENLKEVITNVAQLRLHIAEFSEMYSSIVKMNEDGEAFFTTVTKMADESDEMLGQMRPQAEELKTIFDQKQKLEEEIKELEVIFKTGDDYDSKLSSLFKSINERRKEIDQLYYEIVGYATEGDDGNIIPVQGLKQKLQESYSKLETDFGHTSKRIEDFESNTRAEYNTFVTSQKESFETTLKDWKAKYEDSIGKIKSLLPNAMTAGLSYAYSEKKAAEVLDLSKHLRSFTYSIAGLIFISLLPFGVGLTLLLRGEELIDTINRIPQMILSILPLYFPVLWVAYSANKKIKLAKRLIEEYSHKEVLSKTFEGLSKHISDIEDKDISNDLKIKLLYNILEVNSENPGKLISDYNKSDHPLMDALDKSVKLTNAVSKLAKIPGFGKLAAKLDKQSQAILTEEGRKASAGLEAVDLSNGKAKPSDVS
jgi:hypothetical protein